MAALVEGQRFGDYEILGQIGRGGMGTVYKAREISLDRTVALKVLLGELALDHDYLVRFEREASLAAKLNHPSIVRVLTAGEHNGSRYIVMEMVEGESVRERLARTKRIDPEEALAISVYVAQALDYAWRQAQLIHRDIKPGNIYLSQAGEVKLGDLGLAKSLSDSTGGLTSTGLALGTPNYVSPEQGRGLKDIDFRADIYSLGCTLYHMLTGQPPYPGLDSMAVIHKHIYEPLPPILQVLPTCPMPLVFLLGKMMSKHPNGRHQTYQELIADLQRIHDQLQQPPAPAVGSASTTLLLLRKPRAQAWAVGVALAAVTGAALFWWAPWRGSPPPAPEPRRPHEIAVLVGRAPLPATAAQPASPDATPSAPAATSPEELISRVVGKLRELNSAYNGQFAHKAENGAVVELMFLSDEVSDISPLRELPQLRRLYCRGSHEKRTLADLTPLRGMRLQALDCGDSRVSDLTPLAGMPLEDLRVAGTLVSDLAPLKGAPLTHLDCWGTRVADLSPLRGAPLRWLNCGGSQVTDFSPLEGAPLEELHCRGVPAADLSPLKRSPLRLLDCDAALAESEAGLAMLGSMPTLQKINNQLAAEFLKRDPAAVAMPAPPREPPAAEELPPELQLARVVAKLRELNPRFDGRVTHKIENGAVTELSFSTIAVKDISPVRELKGLKKLALAPSSGKAMLADLSPLQGLQLTGLWCQNTQVADLSPLKGMPLTALGCGSTPISDLVPLHGMPLQVLSCDNTVVSNLLPLEGLPLAVLWCHNAKVEDLSPLQQLPLREVRCDFVASRDAGVLRAIKTLEKINELPAVAFWMRLGAAGQPSAKEPVPAAKPRLVDETFIRLVAISSPEEQVARVMAKLKQLNPGFDGQETHAISEGQVQELAFSSAVVADISPLRALPKLRKLNCCGLNDARALASLSPLSGMALESLDCSYSQVSDLTPLKGMPLQHLVCSSSRVTDLSPLKGAPLTRLNLWVAPVTDLSPLAGSPLRWLNCKGTRANNLSPLRDTMLEELHCDPALVSQHATLLRAISTLKIVNSQPFARP
ncbi:MAG: protein kinase [Verrucomicrobia bacterium]|nr:protein kinase [Verrucomicrobiota bacterium]